MNVESQDQSAFRSDRTIDDAVRYAIHAVDGDQLFQETPFTSQEVESIQAEKSSWSVQQKYLRGIFAVAHSVTSPSRSFGMQAYRFIQTHHSNQSINYLTRNALFSIPLSIWELTNIPLADPIP